MLNCETEENISALLDRTNFFSQTRKISHCTVSCQLALFRQRLIIFKLTCNWSRGNNDIPYKYDHKLIHRCGYLTSLSSPPPSLSFCLDPSSCRTIRYSRNDPPRGEKLANVAEFVCSFVRRSNSITSTGLLFNHEENRRYEAIGYSYSRKLSATFRHIGTCLMHYRLDPSLAPNIPVLGNNRPLFWWITHSFAFSLRPRIPFLIFRDIFKERERERMIASYYSQSYATSIIYFTFAKEVEVTD